MKSDIGKEYLAGWMRRNESSLKHGEQQNYYSSGKLADCWRRVAKGKFEGVQFRIFDREGKQDCKRLNNFIVYDTPADYAVVWYTDDGVIIRLEWRNLDDALRLGSKIANGFGYYDPKEQ